MYSPRGGSPVAACGIGNPKRRSGERKNPAFSLVQVVGDDYHRLQEAEEDEQGCEIAGLDLEGFTLERRRPATFSVAVVTDRPIKAV